MGLIAAFGFILCFGILFDVSRRCANWTTRQAKVESPSTRRRIFAATFLSVAASAWLILSFSNIRDQWEMNQVSADCGWKEYKRVEQVDGVYVEDQNGNPPNSAASDYLTLYPAAEYRDWKGQFYRVTRSTVPREKPQPISGRSFRYGAMSSQELISKKIIRAKYTILDFDSNEVLAENIRYSFKDNDFYTFKGTFFAFVKFPRHGCGMLNAKQWEQRTISILQPKGTHTPEQYTAVINRVAKDVELEVLKSETANPVQRMTSEEWTQASHDRTRHGNCQHMLRVEHPGSRFYSFSHDPGASKKAYRRNSIQLCESSEIWLASYVDDSDESKMIIEKYSQAGDLIYKARIPKPEQTGDSFGSIIGPSFHAEGGYVNFEWWNTKQASGLREIHRRMRVRFKEPSSTG